MLALLSGVAALFVPINYDLTSYLPESAESTRALEEMDAEFDAAVPVPSRILRTFPTAS